MGIDYSTVTEVPGNRVTRDQLERMVHRYSFAAQFSEGKDVLEVACGAGQGLGFLAKKAKRVFGGDYTENLVKGAKGYYQERIPLLRLDAHILPFRTQCFDVVIIYEAIYYLTKPEDFFEEVRRVLRKGGLLLIATVNKDWSEFNSSPFSTRYFSVPELSELLQKKGFNTEMFGAFSVLPNGAKEKIIASVRKLAVILHLIPKTMKGKELLKKIFYGELKPLQGELEEGAYEYAPPVSIPSDVANHEFKVIYAVAQV
ncbi:MAG: class I SAM-dependent methyltransferase [Deltaproteobacteria bacterium]|nr:class I SAM-dependent methyltransferase [Deltaproteobacteria bacterium]